MDVCGRKALALLGSVLAALGLGLLGVAVATDYWLYLEEGVILPLNQTAQPRSALHAGLWRVCFLAGEEKGRCFTMEHVLPSTVQMASEATASVLKMIRSATPFPLVSLCFMFVGFLLSNMGHMRPHHTILAFVSGIFFILSGLSLVVGLVLYISSITDELLTRTRTSEAYLSYSYGWSFTFAAVSFLLTEAAGVMSVYLFMQRYVQEELCRPPQGFLRPRLSTSSSLPLHSDALAASSVSSEASLPLSPSSCPPPALLSCPVYQEVTSSSC